MRLSDLFFRKHPRPSRLRSRRSSRSSISSLHFESLEPRLLLSAAPAGSAIAEPMFLAPFAAAAMASDSVTGSAAPVSLVDSAPPQISARVFNDTGISSTDGVTSNSTVAGRVQAGVAIAAFQAGFDTSTEASFVSILADLTANGLFALTPTRLAQVNGGPLADGAHTLHLRATDNDGNVGELDIAFTLDTTPPFSPSLDLLSSSDSGLSGNDNITNDMTPTLAFTVDPAAQLLLFHDYVLVTTLPPGTFTATVEAPGPGTFSYNAFARDVAGNFSDSSVPLLITFDPIAPESPGFELSAGSLVGPAGVARVIVPGDATSQAIPDSGTILSTATVSGIAGAIFDVNVTVTLSHEALSDLTGALISPAGTRVELFSGLTGVGLTVTQFDDSGPMKIAAGAGSYTGRFLPSAPLALLNGEDPNGVWTLELTDDVPERQGTLQEWSLALRTATGLPSVAGVSAVSLSGWTDPAVSLKLLETGTVTTSGADGSFSFSGVILPTITSQWTVSATDRAGNESTYRRDLVIGQGRAFLRGTVFHDRDGGGTRTLGEPALPGWTLYLDLNQNEALDEGEPSTVTDATGSYAFVVSPGTYTIAEVEQLGWEHTSPTGRVFELSVVEGEVRSGLDFGNLQLGDLTGLAFHDLDADGSHDAGEPVLEGWTIYLDANDNGRRDPGERSAVTNAQGVHRWDDLRPGPYVVREELPAGWRETAPDSGAHSVILAGGQVVTDLDFAVVQLGALHGSLFEDLDGNGVREAGEPGLADWTLYLDTNGNGVRDSGEATTITAADGEYEFPDLFPGVYRVAEEVPTGWLQTFPRLQPPGPTAGPADLALVQTDAADAPLLLPDERLLAGDELSLEAAGPADMLTQLDAVLADPRFADLDGRGMTIVVIDTGIDVNHPFFGPDANGDGVADRLIAQVDFANGDADASDRSGHGSHIASVIGSQDAGVRGVAPAAQLIALKVFEDTGAGQFRYLEQALQWVIANATTYSIDVVNLSLGDGGNWTDAIGRYGLGDELAAIANLGIIEIAAAGNSFFSVASQPGVAYPAADPSIISAGAVWTADFGGPFSFGSGARDETTGPDRIAAFSQRHATLLDTFAPGARFTGANQNGGTTTLQGTSQASAYLSGLAILAQQLAQRELGRSLAPAEFVELLRDTGRAIVDGDDEQDNVTNTGLTFPRVDALALMNAVRAVTGPGPGVGGGGDGDVPTGGGLVAHSVVLSGGQNLAALDFGNFKLGEIRGVVFNDVNADGLQGTGETGLFGWTVYLDANRNGAKDPTERRTVTDATGRYLLEGVGPGSLVLRVEGQSRWGRTGQSGGSPDPATMSGAQVTANLGHVLITLDVDGDGTVSAFTDGRLIVRYLAGVADPGLTAGGVVGPMALRAAGSEIRGYLAAAQGLSHPMLDADADGAIQSATDGKLILRYLAGVPDTQLIQGGAIGPNAANLTPDAIRAFLDSFQPPASAMQANSLDGAGAPEREAAPEKPIPIRPGPEDGPDPAESSASTNGTSAEPPASGQVLPPVKASAPVETYLEGGQAFPQTQTDAGEGDGLVVAAVSPAPDLGPYPVFGGPESLVVSTQPGTNSSSPAFSELDNLYIDWAIDNHGDIPTEAPFVIEVRVDGQTVVGYLVDFPLDLDTALYDEDRLIGRLSAGLHEIQLIVDSMNTIDELNEGDNVASKFIGVAPANDDRSRAVTIGHGQAVAQTDTRFATASPDDPQPTCRTGLDGHTVWYRYVASEYGILTVDTAGSSFNTVLSAYSSTLQELACNDDAAAGQLQSRLQFEVNRGEEYLLQVGAFGATEGGGLRLNTAFAFRYPNLAFVQPEGWSDQIIISLEPGTHTDSPVLTAGDRPFVDFAIINNGDVPTSAGFVVRVVFQGGLQTLEVIRSTPLAPSEVFLVEDLQLGPIASGPSELILYADSQGSVAESDESDNYLYKSVEVAARPGAVRGMVFHDRNADGVQDVGEEPVSNWTVYLDRDGSLTLSAGDDRIATDQLGQFEFAGLSPRVYGVGVEVPPDRAETTGASQGVWHIRVVDAQVMSVTFGLAMMNHVTGTVFADANGDGIHNPGEAAIPNIVVYADLNNSGTRQPGLEPEVRSKPDGSYDLFEFSYKLQRYQRLFGIYPIRIEVPSGFALTLPTVGGGYPISITADGTVYADLDFGLLRTNEAPIAHEDRIAVLEDTPPFRIIGNVLLNDLDPDNRPQALFVSKVFFLESNVGLPLNVSAGVFVLQADGSYTYDWDNNLLQALRAGDVAMGFINYSVSDGQLEAFNDVVITVAGINDVPVITSSGSGEASGVSVPEGSRTVLSVTAIDADFPNSLQFTVIGGDDQAKFSIDAATGVLSFQTPPDFENPTDADRDNVYEVIIQVSDGFPSGIDRQTILVRVTDVDMPGLLLGWHYEDLDGDGLRDPGEPALASWTVYLDENGNGLMDASERRTTTDASGTFQFSNLTPGIHQVAMVPQSGWVRTGSVLSSPLTPSTPILVHEGPDSSLGELGSFRLGEIQGVAFEDVNADGIRALDESVFSGWTVFLDTNGNGVKDVSERSTITDGVGGYRFAQVGPGTASVRAEGQPHWGQTRPAGGSAVLPMTSGASLVIDLGHLFVTLDVDGDGTVSPFTDGRLIARGLAGVSDAGLTAGGAVGTGAIRDSAAELRGYLAAAQGLPESLLDVDGDGVSGQIDGRLMLRYLAGLPDAQVVAGLTFSANATRTTGQQVREFLETFQPSASALSASSPQMSASNPEPRAPNPVPLTVPMGYAASLAAQSATLATVADDQPLLAGSPAWLGDFVVSDAVLTDDPNRNLAVMI